MLCTPGTTSAGPGIINEETTNPRPVIIPGAQGSLQDQCIYESLGASAAVLAVLLAIIVVLLLLFLISCCILFRERRRTVPKKYL